MRTRLLLSRQNAVAVHRLENFLRAFLSKTTFAHQQSVLALLAFDKAQKLAPHLRYRIRSCRVASGPKAALASNKSHLHQSQESQKIVDECCLTASGQDIWDCLPRPEQLATCTSQADFAYAPDIPLRTANNARNFQITVKRKSLGDHLHCCRPA